MSEMEISNDRVLKYIPPGPVATKFLQSNNFIRGIMGPLGSGKSAACTIEILRRAQRQAKGPDGIRRTRWAIIRNSYPELKSTTLKTWSDWCPTSYGKMNMDAPFVHHVKLGEIDMEVLFLALDSAEDAKKLLSLELTGAWINEAREVPKAVIDALTGRVGRYPSKIMGGATWSGIMMDTNPPDQYSWWYKMAEETPHEDWSFFKQPSGLSPQAENLHNLPKDYYKRLLSGKDPDWIKVYVNSEYGFLIEGKPVYSMFRDSTHVAAEAFPPSPNIPIRLGADFGRTPSAIFGQVLSDGRWQIFDEFITEDCGVTRFKELLEKYIAEKYSDFEVISGTGDPAGNDKGQNDEKTAMEIMNNSSSYNWKGAPTNVITMRLEVVINALNRMVDGKPGILISPKCEMIRKGFNGGYHYKLLRTGDGKQTHEAPNKNEYSHPHDALQYLLLGGGEADVVLNKRRRSERRSNIKVKGLDYEIFKSK